MTLEQFKRRVVAASLFPPTNLAKAIERLGFVQADPIRCPARAQDLILRHRVKGYRAGDLERAYPDLGLEECYLFAYGFGSRALWRVIQPRAGGPLSDVEAEVVRLVGKYGAVLPKDLESDLGHRSVTNYWGGTSREVKMILERLHHRGILRVARRSNGHRVYGVAKAFDQTKSASERYSEVLQTTLETFGACTRQFLLRETGNFRYLIPDRSDRVACVKQLLEEGRIRSDVVDGIEYLSPERRRTSRRIMDGVRILAPFDPVVRDRQRFEHLWGWKYRFEAYVPKAKRILGYYAMPLLWRSDVIGWANAGIAKQQLEVELRFVGMRPKEPEFDAAVFHEMERFRVFLGVEDARWESID